MVAPFGIDVSAPRPQIYLGWGTSMPLQCVMPNIRLAVAFMILGGLLGCSSSNTRNNPRSTGGSSASGNNSANGGQTGNALGGLDSSTTIESGGSSNTQSGSSLPTGGTSSAGGGISEAGGSTGEVGGTQIPNSLDGGAVTGGMSGVPYTGRQHGELYSRCRQSGRSKYA